LKEISRALSAPNIRTTYRVAKNYNKLRN